MGTSTKQNILSVLAKRERQIFDLIIQGKRTKEISEILSLKANTISTVKRVIQKKLHASNSMDLFKIAQSQHLL